MLYKTQGLFFMNAKHFLLALLIAFVLLAGCTQQPPSNQLPNQTPPSLSVSDQSPLQIRTINIDSVFLDKPGFVVIHDITAPNVAGDVIGNSILLNGEAKNVKITLNRTVSKAIAMLHYDNGDGAYTTLDEDIPVRVNGTVLQRTFNITLPPVPPPQNQKGGAKNLAFARFGFVRWSKNVSGTSYHY